MRFTIRDLMWLTVVVSVALALWLGWSRQTALLKKESAAREAKLHKKYADDSDINATSWNRLHAEYTKVRAQLKTQATLPLDEISH